jgi:hypothetical protein
MRAACSLACAERRRREIVMSFKGRIEVLAGIFALFAGAGCDIRHCEGAAKCDDMDDLDRPGRDEHPQCISYCGRINLCGGPRGEDIEGCISACEERFRLLPDETAALCACAPQSSCSDVNEGRCSAPPGPGGSSSGGASSGTGGVASGSGGNPPAAGGASSMGGTSSSGGTGTGAAGGAPVDAGPASGTPCVRDCDCPATETCIGGFCGR